MLFTNSTLWKPSWARRYDEANSPLHMWTKETKELRSQLFPERLRIPSRKAKYILTLGLVLQMWGMYEISLVRKQFKRKGLEKKKLERKAAPFLQAIADIRYCSIAEKTDLIMQELFTPEYYERVKDRYFQKDLWVPFRARYPHMYNRTTKDPRDYQDSMASRYLHGIDLYNI